MLYMLTGLPENNSKLVCFLWIKFLLLGTLVNLFNLGILVYLGTLGII